MGGRCFQVCSDVFALPSRSRELFPPHMPVLYLRACACARLHFWGDFGIPRCLPQSPPWAVVTTAICVLYRVEANTVSGGCVVLGNGGQGENTVVRTGGSMRPTPSVAQKARCRPGHSAGCVSLSIRDSWTPVHTPGTTHSRPASGMPRKLRSGGMAGNQGSLSRKGEPACGLQPPGSSPSSERLPEGRPDAPAALHTGVPGGLGRFRFKSA